MVAGLFMGNFRKLSVWQRAKDLAVTIYRHTSEGDISRDFGLRDQIRRAAVSIPSNIAEGDERNTNKQAIQFFYNSKGSCAEVITQSMIAYEIGYLNEETFLAIEKECTEISKMLMKLIQIRSKSP